jgi:hypothetical protein
MITLRVTVGREVQAQAWFDETMCASLEVSPSVLEEEMAGKKARIATNPTIHDEDERDLRTARNVGKRINSFHCRPVFKRPCVPPSMGV